MWWSPLLRPRPTRRPDGGCTVVEPDAEVPVAPWVAAIDPSAVSTGELRLAALRAARVHADGPAVAGAVAAAAVFQPLTSADDARRFQAWLLQGLYHRLAGAEASRADRDELVVTAHRACARGALRLAATSPDPSTARRARAALGHLARSAAR